MSKKISLVLEGGGMRGAYTAGCLSWFVDEGIEFDGGYGISTGGIYLTVFMFRNKEWLRRISTEFLPAKDTLGVPALLKEGQIVAYNHIFEKIVKHLGLDLNKLETRTKAKIGLYDLDLGKTIYLPLEKMDYRLILAACSLPLLGKVTKEDGHTYLDGGITDMIPVEESIKDGYDKHFIITTKPLEFTRKPAKKIVVKIMKMAYKNCENISKDYDVRHINYERQKSLINNLVNEGKALYRYPTGKVKVTRLGGSKEDLEDLFDMGRRDMENMREEIYKFLEQ